MIDRMDVAALLLVTGLGLVGVSVWQWWGLPALLAYSGVTIAAAALAMAVVAIRGGVGRG